MIEGNNAKLIYYKNFRSAMWEDNIYDFITLDEENGSVLISIFTRQEQKIILSSNSGTNIDYYYYYPAVTKSQ